MCERQWIPVSQPPIGKRRQVGCLQTDETVQVQRFGIGSLFREDTTHWCELGPWPPFPEPAKPLLQWVCERMWPEGAPKAGDSWAHFAALNYSWSEIAGVAESNGFMYDALLWRIEERLIRAKGACPRWSGLFAKDVYRLTVNYDYCQRSFEARTRGDALLKAAKWVMVQDMVQESGDD